MKSLRSRKSKTKLVAPSQSPKVVGAQPSALVVSYSSAAQSEATTRSYCADIRHFQQHGGAIPAPPTMVAEYLAAFAGKLAIATLQHRLIAIHRMHIDKGLPSPIMENIVKKTMSGIRRTWGTAQRRVRALSKDDLTEILVMVDRQKRNKAARDRALLLVGFAGAFRRSELVALRTEDVSWHDNGVELLIRKSKTDQVGAGRTVFIPYAVSTLCPVKALANWLSMAEIDSGPLFRPINRHDQVVGISALTSQSVALIVKSSVRMLSGDAAASVVAGHSLRAGYCTEAAMAGLTSFTIREQTGHVNIATLDRYVRPVNKRKTPSLL